MIQGCSCVKLVLPKFEHGRNGLRVAPIRHLFQKYALPDSESTWSAFYCLCYEGALNMIQLKSHNFAVLNARKTIKIRIAWDTFRHREIIPLYRVETSNNSCVDTRKRLGAVRPNSAKFEAMPMLA